MPAQVVRAPQIDLHPQPGSQAARKKSLASNAQPDLMAFYRALSESLGPMNWWPARTPFEMIVGAILTQSTAWVNVELAIANLRRERMLTFAAMERSPLRRLEQLVRPSGYFRQKARKLKSFVAFVRKEFHGSLTQMFRTPTAELRERLLSVHGIGPETADSILLYAGGHSVFVVDAYTHRLLGRHGIATHRAGARACGAIASKPDYETARTLLENRLERDPQLYNEFHALIVAAGKNWCHKTSPRCAECPLHAFLPHDSPLRSPITTQLNAAAVVDVADVDVAAVAAATEPTR